MEGKAHSYLDNFSCLDSQVVCSILFLGQCQLKSMAKHYLFAIHQGYKFNGKKQFEDDENCAIISLKSLKWSLFWRMVEYRSGK